MKILYWIFIPFYLFAQLGDQLATNYDMELDSEWSGFATETGDTTEQSTDRYRKGSYSWRVKVDANAEGIVGDTQFSYENGKSYRRSIWIYQETGSEYFRLYTLNLSSEYLYTINTGSWINLVDTVTATSSGSNGTIRLQSSGSGSWECYIDDINIQEILGTQFSDTTWLFNIPCNDSTTNTSVTNTGTGQYWSASVPTNTIILKDVQGRGSTFFLNADNDYIVSNDSIYFEDIYVEWYMRRTSSATSYLLQLNDNLAPTMTFNSWRLYCLASDSLAKFVGRGNDNIQRIWETKINVPGMGGYNDNIWHKYILMMDASAVNWNLRLFVDDVEYLWEINDGDLAPALFSSDIQMGTIAVQEVEALIQHLKVIRRSELPKKHKWLSNINIENQSWIVW